MHNFTDGYDFYQKYAGSAIASKMGSAYVDIIEHEIVSLDNNLNSFKGFNTSADALKGDVAEFWHSGTFNINAALNDSSNRTTVDRSHDFASADVTGNFGEIFGLKYYKDGVSSAKAQSVSVFQRYSEYIAQGGTDTLGEFLSKRGYDNYTVLNDPIYGGQIRIIPKDQMNEAVEWLQRKIQEESVKRPEQVQRYQETLDMLRDKISDNQGNKSITLSKDDSEKLAQLAKEGGFNPEDFGLTTEELISYKYVLQQAFKAGLTAATITMVLKIAPEIIKAIDYLIKNGEIDREQFKKIGFAAVNGAAEGFIRGSVSAAITTACKAGLWGAGLKSINPTVVGTSVVIVMDTMKNSFYVAKGEMSRRELANELVKEMFISSCSLIGGGIGQALVELPAFGFMIGSFVGSAVGSFAYSVGYQATLSLCADTGFTMFGLVEQDYTLPDDVIRDIGIEVFEYDKLEYLEFQFDEFHYEKFEYDEFDNNTSGITFLRRGVIGVSQIGYL